MPMVELLENKATFTNQKFVNVGICSKNVDAQYTQISEMTFKVSHGGFNL